jgi:hypothetical protein
VQEQVGLPTAGQRDEAGVWRPCSAMKCWTRGTPACPRAARSPRPLSSAPAASTMNLATNTRHHPHRQGAVHPPNGTCSKRSPTHIGVGQAGHPQLVPAPGLGTGFPARRRTGRSRSDWGCLARSRIGHLAVDCHVGVLRGVNGAATGQTGARRHVCPRACRVAPTGRLNAAPLAALQRRMSELRRQISEHLRQLGRW